MVDSLHRHQLSHLESRLDFFFFNDPATTEIYTLSLHDALPIFFTLHRTFSNLVRVELAGVAVREKDRKSTRLNSSHRTISYALVCLKKKINRTGGGLGRHRVRQSLEEDVEGGSR